MRLALVVGCSILAIRDSHVHISELIRVETSIYGVVFIFEAIIIVETHILN
jgi:hypothetical protein